MNKQVWILYDDENYVADIARSDPGDPNYRHYTLASDSWVDGYKAGMEHVKKLIDNWLQ